MELEEEEPPKQAAVRNGTSTRSNGQQHSLVISVAMNMNPTRRSNMEDAHSICPPGSWNERIPHTTFLGLYDGHGGRDLVEFIQHAMPFHLAQELDSMEGDEETRKLKVLRAFLMADIHARKVGIVSSGAAVAVALVQRTPEVPSLVRLIAANVGDSRVVAGIQTIDRNTGTRQLYTERLTFDHSATLPAEMERMEKTGGFCYRGRVLGVLALSRSMGDHCLKDMVLGEPYVREALLDLRKGVEHGTHLQRAFVVLACDGLFDVMEDCEVTELVASWTGDLEDAAKQLVQEGLRRGTADNISVVVAHIQVT